MRLLGRAAALADSGIEFLCVLEPDVLRAARSDVDPQVVSEAFKSKPEAESRKLPPAFDR